MSTLNFSHAYVLPNSWKSALVPYFAGIANRIGWRGEARYRLLTASMAQPKSQYPLMIERFMALANAGELPTKPYPLPRLVPNADNAQRLRDRFELPPDKTIAVLCPGAEFGAAKKWPAEHYAEVARALLSAGYGVWLLGSPKDVEDCRLIASLAPGAANLAGRTTLLDAVDLISLARWVVSNDSGLMHIACALEVETVGIFGSTSPDFTPPLGEAAHVLQIELPCRPCFQRECPLQHLDCLVKLKPQAVVQKLLGQAQA